MKETTTNTLIEALKSVLSELTGLMPVRILVEPWDIELPEHRAKEVRYIRVGVGGAEIDQVVWILPEETGARISARMYFGMDVNDSALIDAAVTELFCRVTTRALERNDQLRIAEPPALERSGDEMTNPAMHGVTVRFDSAAGPFTMNLLLAPA